MHEVVCDVTHKTPTAGGHVLLLIGFDRNRKVFFAKNHWGENQFIEIQYQNDPNWSIDSGWYIKDVVDPTFVQNEGCWLGNWWVTMEGGTSRMLLRRSEDFASPGKPTKLGSVYLGDGRHNVNGQFLDSGYACAPIRRAIDGSGAARHAVRHRDRCTLDFTDIYNATGTTALGRPVTLSRFATRFAALFEKDDGIAWQARHGIDGATYQQTFDTLVAQGFRLTSICGYSEGRDARFNAVWQQRAGSAWQARHGMTAEQYQATFNNLCAKASDSPMSVGTPLAAKHAMLQSGNIGLVPIGRLATE